MENYSYHLSTNKSAREIFDLLLNIKTWWSGIYQETITGKSRKINEEFTFSAGKGMHFSKQKLVEIIQNKKLVWEVTESDLSFLENPKEWEHTKLIFDIVESKDKTEIIFTHEGLEPKIECYGDCSTAWTQYLQNLDAKLKEG